MQARRSRISGRAPPPQAGPSNTYLPQNLQMTLLLQNYHKTMAGAIWYYTVNKDVDKKRAVCWDSMRWS